MTDKPKSNMLRQIMRGVAAGGRAAIERARQTNTRLVVWENGKVKKIAPDSKSLAASALSAKGGKGRLSKTKKTAAKKPESRKK